jgi:hypothetical protein
MGPIKKITGAAYEIAESIVLMMNCFVDACRGFHVLMRLLVTFSVSISVGISWYQPAF